MTDRRVVVTGLGAVTPLGNTTETFWRRLVDGESGVRTIDTLVQQGFPVTFGAECSEFDPLRYIDGRRIKRLDRCAQFAVAAAKMAAEDSGVDFDRTDPYRIGIMLGTGMGGVATIEEQHRRMLEKGVNRVSAFTIARMMLNAASGQISLDFNARGPVTTVATACASSNNALADAVYCIRRNEVDVAFAGGTESVLTQLGVAGFNAMKALSQRNDDPQRASRPFDRDRDGFVMGEGAGMMILEELAHAKRRGARIYGEIVGFGCSADSYDIVQPHPDGEVAARAVEMALEMAGVSADQIDLISAHGTGTTLGDVAETRAIRRVFGPAADGIPVTATKSSVGHLLGASGAVEMLACLLSIRDGIIPPTLNLENPDPECDLDYVPLRARESRVDVVVNNSFGFGGHNAVVVARRFA